MAAIGFGPRFRSLEGLKKGFFDRAAVEKAAGRAMRRVLSKLGAFVRQRAKTSMRASRTGRPSNPGRPPNAHEGSLRKLIYFAFDPGRQSVIVGPVLFKKSPHGIPVPELQEYGGDVPGGGRVAWITREAGRNERGQFVTRGKERVVLDGTIHYPARPYMRPALAAETAAGRTPALLRNSIAA